MQTVSSAFTTAAAAPANQPNFGVLISWLKNFTPGTQFFQIGVSQIGGTNPIKGAGNNITLFDKYDYVVESGNVNNLTVERTMSAIPIGIMSAQLDLELNNATKRYLPKFDPTIGNYIKPGRPIKINSGFNDEVIAQFTGFTGRPKTSLGNRKFNVHAFDAMEFLNNFTSNLGMQTNISAKDFIALLLVEAGFSSSAYVLEDSVQSAIGFINPYGKKSGELIDEVVRAEGGLFFFDEQGIARFWNRLHFDLNSTPVGTLNYSNLIDLQFNDTPVINSVRMIAKPRAVTANQLVYRLAQSIELQPGEVQQFVFNIKDDDGDLPCTTIDTPLYVDSQITSFYRTNTKSDGSGSPQNNLITRTNWTTWGTGGMIEFTNSSTSDVMYITDLQIYGTPAKVVTTIVEEYTDAASIADNGVNPDNSGQIIEYTNDYIQDRGTAQAFVFNIVNQFSQVGRQLNGIPFANPAWQFGDVFTVNIADTSETLTMVMLGNKLNMDRTTALSQQMTLEERTFRNYFKIGVSQIGGPDAIHA